MLDYASIRARRYEPNVRCVGHFDKATLYGLLEFGLQTIVGYTAMYGYDQLGQFELPVVFEQFYDVLWLRVEREANILGNSKYI